ncbi:oxidoreductase [Chloropicon primus]|uniref:Oxidoreductase n=2 Tax=Chloropicon primus TaxID=1764295 RepID=A0A5B8MEZ7_9CHLO|nr:oxidoreductase [Chloropicon primus]UPQ98207.1 oxidoreductase [Chloropicon primus]|eukprot:QDZ18999.1 oxidoreductase [Chloropicon primus]
MGEEGVVVRVALVGAGNFAENTYVPLLTSPELRRSVSISAVWSRSQAKVDKLCEGLTGGGAVKKYHAEDGLEAVLRSNDVDAVIVLLPPKAGLEVTAKALRLGKHVLQEKPVGTSRRDVQSILEEYGKMGEFRPLWGVAENYRYEEAYAEARNLIEGDLGPLISLTLNASLALNESSCYWHTPWRHSTEELPAVDGVGIGYLFEGPVHFMAAIRKLVGCTRGGAIHASATLMAKNQALSPQQLDTLVGFLRFEGDESTPCVPCSISITYAASRPLVLFVAICERGNFTIERVPGKYRISVVRAGQTTTTETREVPFNGVEREVLSFVRGVQKFKAVAGEAPANLRRKVGLVPEECLDLSPVEALLDMDCLLSLFEAAQTNQVTPVPQHPSD